MTENMPGPCAIKPGDIVRSKNGKTIVVEDTDFDGRLVLADAITYSGVHSPKAIVSIGEIFKLDQIGNSFYNLMTLKC